jgi:AcrR family transcriptional regulator
MKLKVKLIKKVVHMKKNKREEQKKSNREQILRAALKVFGEIGLDGSNVRDIIRASELSPGTFYNYFESKDQVFEVLLDEIIQDIHNKSRESWLKAWQGERNIQGAFEDFFNIFQNNSDYLHFFAKNQRYVRELRHNGKIAGILANLEGDIETAIEAGMLPSFPVKLVTILLFGCAFEVLAEMIIYPGKISIKEVSESLAIFFRGGIIALSVTSGVKDLNMNILALANLPIDILGDIVKKSLPQKQSNT